MVFLIDNLLDKILVELQIFNPTYSREFDDPRLDTYYIHPRRSVNMFGKS